MTAEAGPPRGVWRPTLLLAAAALAFWGGLLLFPALRVLLFLAFIAAVLAGILSLPIRLFTRVMPRWLATALTALLLAGAITGAVWLVLPAVTEQARRLVERLPAAAGRVEDWWRSLGRAGLLPDGFIADPSRVVLELQTQIGRILAGVLPFAGTVLTALMHILAAVVLAFFIAHGPTTYERGLLALVPQPRVEGASAVLRAMAGAVRSWSAGILVSMTIVGLLTGFGLWIVGIDVWFALALIAFWGEFIPFFGPIGAAVPGVLAGLAVSPGMGLKVALVYLIVQQLEGNLIQPLAMRWAVRIAPGLLIVWQIAFATAFGLPGLLVATPLLAALQAGIKKGFIEGTLGKSGNDRAVSEPPPASVERAAKK